MKYTFEAYKEDGSPRKMAGIFRPPRQEAYETWAKGPTSHYNMYYFWEEYNGGRLDKPLYEDDE